MLKLFAGVEEEPTIVGASGEASDKAGAAAKRTAEVVPPCLAEVEAVGERGAGDGSITCVDGLEGEFLVRRGLLRQLEVKIGHEAARLADEPGLVADSVGDFLGLVELTETLL